MNYQSGDVTGLLAKLQGGNRDVEPRLIELVYGELRRLAAYHLRGERPGHTLQATALVHEAYMKLAAQRDASSDEREQSFAGLMLGVATGSPPGDGEAWLRRLGVHRPITVRDVASRYATP